MTQIGTAYVEVKPDLSGFSRSVGRELDGAKSGLKSQMSGFAKSAAAGLAAGAAVGVGLIAKNAITAASDINESLSKNDKLFGRYAKGVEKFASSSAKSYGISKKAALEYTGVFGNLFRALGQSEKAASGNSVQLTKLAADMASFNNTSVEDALEAIRSGLVGETEPLRKFGVNMNDATLKTEALALAKKGLISQAEATAKTLSPETKAMAAQSLIMKQTSQAHGDFKDTSSSLANQQKILKARLDDASAAIGARLLPFAVKGANALNDMLTSAQNGTGVFGFLKNAVEWVSGAFDKFKASLGGGEGGGGFAAKAMTSFQQLKDAVVTTFTTIVAVGGALWRTFGDTIVDHLKDTVNMVVGVLQGIITAFKGIVDIISGVLTGDWGKAWTGVKEVFSGVWQAIGAVVTGAWENIKTIVSLGVTAIGTIIKAAAGALLDLGKWIVGKIADGLKAYAQLWIDAAGWIKNRIVDAIKAVGSAFLDAGKWVLNRVVEGVKTITGALSDIGGWLKNRIVEFVQREAAGIVNIGTWVINRVVEGVKTVTEALSSVGGWLKNRLLNGFENIKDGFLDIGGSIIGWIVSGLKAGANKIVSFLNVIIGLVNKIPGVEIGKIAGLAQGGQFSAAGVEGFATGGEVRRGTKLTRPMIMMGEEAPRHPEFVIPTNPAYRKRALGLYGQLGSALGVGYADGGVIGHASGVLSDVGNAVVKTVTGVLPTGLLEKGASWLLDKLPNPADMLPDWLIGTGKYVIDKVGDWIKDKITGLLGSSGGVQGAGAGVGQFDGKPVASWIIPILKAARASGVAFNVSSGFRSFAEQTRLWNQLGRDPAIVARPGTSNHEGSAYPRGAVDISPGWQALASWLARRNLPLHHYGNPRDPYHFSATGHAKGGIIGGDGASLAPFVGSYANGGVVPRDGLAYVHQGETISPQGVPEVRVFIGDRELTDIVRVEYDEQSRRKGAMMRAGVLA